MNIAYQFLLRDSLRLRKTLPWLILSVLGMALGISLKTFLPGATPTDRFVNVVNVFVFRLLPLASAVYTTMIVSQEVEQKTIVYLLTRPIARWQLLIGRFLATVSAVVLLSTVGLIFAYFGAGGTQVNVSIARDLLAIVLGGFAYGSLFLLVSLFFNRALIICVLFAFGWESSVPNLPSGLQSLSVLTHMQSIASHPEAKQGQGFLRLIQFLSGDGSLSAGTSAFTLIVMTVLLLGWSAYWFTTHEYIPREDSE